MVGWKGVDFVEGFVFFFLNSDFVNKKKITHYFFVVVIFVWLAFCVWIDLSDLIGRLGWLEGLCVFFRDFCGDLKINGGRLVKR